MKEVGGKAAGLIVWSSSRVGNHDLFTMNTDGSDVKQITKGDEVDWFPRFSPDGKQILSLGADGTIRIWPDDLPSSPEALRAWLRTVDAPARGDD